ncbi:hypothetical protein D8857_04020 [Streptococcus oralis]|uniref:Uncharacterized protein n=1 Tax=Streptococcus oralis TaxID=1303 RepID=A0A3R9J9V9_STROR|nr:MULTISPECIES: hypothetical protein [Streptococcus]OFL51533.1 hypothetical protein HMPREF2766_03615 [Streptococcus sp. HMSC076C08]OFP33724.1 hypothetical protein HMPREF2991_06870 [Streptococcus sp. HMSC072D07]RSI72852.1 hypothetical protein D8857_04020 [Streptococcus oralis]
MKKRALILLVLSIVVFGGGAWLAQETNLFLSPRAKQLAYLKEHEEEIKEFVKSLNPKVESVQIDWKQTQWDKIGNGTPQGGGEIVQVYGGFNNISNSSWSVIIKITDGKILINSIGIGSPLRIGGKLLD